MIGGDHLVTITTINVVAILRARSHDYNRDNGELAKCERRLIQAIKEKKCVNKACRALLIARVLLIVCLLPYIKRNSGI